MFQLLPRGSMVMGRWVAAVAAMWLASATSPANASLEAYDSTVASDAAGGLKPIARLSSGVTLTGGRGTPFDFGVNSGSATAEFILEGNPAANSSAYLAVGANSASNLRYNQWSATRQLGFTQLGVQDYLFSPTVASPTQATHVVYAWNATTHAMRLYVNGLLAGSNSGVTPDFAMPAGLGLLGSNPDGSESMTGTIHRVTLYDGLVSEEVILAHADAFRGIVHPPIIASFTATPEAIFTPGSATLAWEVRNAQALHLNGVDVSALTHLTVTPAVTTPYELVASVAGASATARVEVVVNPAPVIRRFVADRSYLPAGASVTLSWKAAYAQTLSLIPGVGDVTSRTVDGSGSISLQPTNSTTFTLTAVSPYGSGSATTEVHVVQMANHLVISEFMANDQSTLPDEEGQFSGWIELFNPTAVPINLAGHYLTDDPQDPTRWAFPSTNLAGGDYLVVFASGKDRARAGLPLHTNFRLNNAGEYLALVGPGPVVLHAFDPAFPPQRPDLSYGLLAADPALARFLGAPTPGAANSEAPPPPPPVEMSRPSGVFAEPFAVTLSASDPAAEIRFTTDGSDPGLTNGMPYTAPVAIAHTTRLRAVALVDGVAGRITGASYVKLAADLAGYSSSLPIMIIDNFGAGTIRQKGWNSTGAGLKQVPRQDAAWFAFERVGNVSSLTNAPQMGSLIGIRGRGAYSSEWSRKPYNVKVWDEAGGEAEASPLGLPSHSDWILYYPDPDPSRDPTMLFNTFAYELSRNMGHYAVRFRWVEAFINEDGGDLSLADRRGVYAIIEQVARGKDRLDFQRLSEDGSSGGWLLNINRMDSEPETGWPAPNGALQPWFFHTAGPNRIPETQPNTAYDGVPGDDLPQQWNGFLNFDNPNGYVINPRQRSAIESWFKRFEDVLYNNALWRDPTNGYRRYLDSRDFADYFLLNVLTRNGDGLLISMFPWKGDDDRLRIGPAWDYNWSSYYISGGPTGSLMYRSECLWYPRLFADPDFAQYYVDRWWALRRGPLSNAAMDAIIDRQAADISPAKALLNGLSSTAEWASRLGQMKAWLKQRAEWIDSNYLRPPVFNPEGGDVPDGFRVTVTGAGGTIYVTTDGTDPRAPGGGLAGSARAYSNPIPLSAPTLVQARIRQGSAWSGLASAVFSTPQNLGSLVLTEIMYNPPAAGNWTGDDLQFLELKNLGTAALNLGGFAFTGGITFTFTNGTQLGAGQFVVLARNAAAFQSRYPGVIVHGSYSGRLSHGGETLRLVTPAGTTVLAVTYNDRAPWPVAADGFGFSVVPRNAALANSDDGARWRASAFPGGSPGADDPPCPTPGVLINEVLAHSNPPQVDAIELFNPTTETVDISGWFLSDDGGVPRKSRIPEQTQIRPGAYYVFTEVDFNPTPGSALNFALDSAGDDVYLTAADLTGQLTGYGHGVSLGASAAGVSFGRWVTSAGEEYFPAQRRTTLGGPNAGPAIGPLVITEIMYHPAAGGVEYLELRNLGDQAVPLFDPANLTNTWRVRGFGFTFPTNQVLASKGVVILAATNAAAFRAAYSVPAGIPVLEASGSGLQDNGERLELQRPDLPGTNGVAYITVDEVRYRESTPWPSGAGGSGLSLQRKTPSAYGNEPANWVAAAPTPGTDYVYFEPPFIVVQPQSQEVLPGSTVTLSVAVTNTATLPLGYLWQCNGALIPGGTIVADDFTCFFVVTNLGSPTAAYSVVVTNAASPEGVLSAQAVLSSLDDADADGMADNWETAYGLSASNPADALLDSDGDGLLNWQEYAVGTDPADASSRLQFNSPVAFVDGTVTLSFQAVSNRTYTLEYTDQLPAETWLRLADTVAPGASRKEVVTDAGWNTNRFYRLITPRRP